jgi:hypothetical protein
MDVDRNASKAAFRRLIFVARKLYNSMMKMCNVGLVVCKFTELGSVIQLGQEESSKWQGAIRVLELKAIEHHAIDGIRPPLESFEC